MMASTAGIPPQTPVQPQQPEKHSTLKFIVIGHGVLSILLLLAAVVIIIVVPILNKRLNRDNVGVILLVLLLSGSWCFYIIYCLVVPIIGSFTENKGFFLVHAICSFLLVMCSFMVVLLFGITLTTAKTRGAPLILLICLILIWIIEGIASVAGGIASGILFLKMNEAEKAQVPGVYVGGGSPAPQTSPSNPQVVNGAPVYQNNI